MSHIITRYTTITQILQERAGSHPEKVAYTFLKDGENCEEKITYWELYYAALGIAQELKRSCQKGDRVILFFPPGLDFIKAFFGCLYAGVIAVPSYPPKKNRYNEKLTLIYGDSQLQAILTALSAGFDKAIETINSRNIPVIHSDQIEYNDPSQVSYATSSDDLAFIQYTSGSTGSPKGVMVSHGNLMQNEYLIQQAFGLNQDSIVVGWLPFYHDMGLIGNILQPIFTGFECILMSPVHFLQKPSRWLKAISKYKATISGGPNFAYDLCIDKISPDEFTDIRLDSWQVAFNGAEPVRAATLENFTRKYKSLGFTKKAFLPCYGMAETTLLVAGKTFGQEPAVEKFYLKDLQYYKEDFNEQLIGDTIELVSCGMCHNFNIALVDEEGKECTPGKVGEIWVQGESVAKGYWNKEKETKNSFGCVLEGHKGTFLRTGDLAVFRDSELYIAGRLKDLIIINGRNYYPHDIELAVAESHKSILKDSIAAFGVDVNQDEKLVLVAEVEFKKSTNLLSIKKSVVKRFVEEFEFTPHDIIFLRKGTIPKTTSGKIQRKACKTDYLNGNLSAIEQAKLSSINVNTSADINFDKMETEIYKLLQEESKVVHVSKDTDLFSLGLDSIQLTRFAYRLGDFYEKEVPVDYILEHNTIESIARQIPLLGKQESVVFNKGIQTAPATGLQELIWFNQQRNPQNTGYNIPVVLEFNSEINIKALTKTADYLINKHPVYNTFFRFEGERLIQEINNFKGDIIEIEDLSGVYNSELAHQIEMLIQQKASSIFDLQKDRLIKITAIKRPGKSFSLLFVIHHIIVDGASVAMLLKEFKDNYNKICVGEAIPDTVIPISYLDFAQSISLKTNENEMLAKKVFWQNQFAETIKPIRLPFQYSKDLEHQRDGNSYYFELDKQVFNLLGKTIETTQVNQYTYLLSAYYLLLNHLTGETDLVIGAPISLRTKKELGETHGLMINTSMMRLQLDTSKNAQQFVNQVYQHTREVIKHADYPFNQLLRDLNLPLQDNQLAITSVFFNYLDFAIEGEFDEIFDAYKANPGVDLNFDLNLYALPTKNKIKFRLDYCKYHINHKSIQLISELYVTFVNKLISDKETSLAKMNIGIPETKNTITPKNKYFPFPEKDIQLSIIKKFKKIVHRFSENIAIKLNDRYITYEELDKLSDNIARCIVAKNGIEESSGIGLLFGHELSMITSILGVLKTGNYYVPLDNEYPFERLKYILQDSGIKCILTNDKYFNKAFELNQRTESNLNIINTDQQYEQFSNFTCPKISNNFLAYILYTSGSTGTPKGVMQTHEYVMHLVHSFTNSLHISEIDCFTLIPSFNFSASVMDLFGVLLNGASLYLVDIKKEGIKGLLEGIKKHDVTIYHSVPTVFRAFCDEIACAEQFVQGKEKKDGKMESSNLKTLPFERRIEESGVRNQEIYNTHNSQLSTYSSQLSVHSLNTLRLMYLAGEPLLKNDVDTYKRLFPDDVILVNGLGCTEFNICRQFFADKKTEINTSVVPIGYKAIGVDVIIVDENRKEVTNIQHGEIAIRSRYLSKGYWNSHDLTESKYKVLDVNTNDRIYYTGDLGIKTIDGCLIHLGRKDFQVKLRGQRIEMGEIESALLKIEGISRAVVVLRQLNGVNFLCGYFKAEEKADNSFIKDNLRRFLPEFMVPAYLIQLDEFPHTDSGKVDRKNLPLPELEINREDKHELTSAESSLTIIWSELLKLDCKKIDKESNFFNLGGHSLTAIQLISAIEKQLSIKFELSEVFANPELSQMAKMVNDKKKVANIKIPLAQKKDYYPVSVEQKRMFVLQLMDKDSISYNITLTCILNDSLDIERFESSIRQLIIRHESLRTHFLLINGEPYQQISDDFEFEVQYHNSRKENIDDIIKDLVKPFNLEESPLIRIHLINIENNTEKSPKQYLLLFDIHHIISDGHSMGLILKDFIAFYEGKNNSPLELQYKDYSEFQNSASYKENISLQKAYWKRVFESEVTNLELPTDYLRPAFKSNEGKRVYFKLDRGKTVELQKIANSQELTLYMLLLGSYYILLSKLANQDDIVIGIPHAGRNHNDFANIIGMFVKTLPIRINSNDIDKVDAFFQNIKMISLNSIENQDYLYEDLIEDLNLNSDLSRNPLFDTMFVYQNMDIDLGALRKLGANIYNYENRNSKFDLTLQGFVDKDELSFHFEYSTNLFKRETIDRFINYYIQIIDAILQKDGLKKSISEIDIITKSEKSKILYEFNKPIASNVTNNNVIHQFEEQVQKTPHKTAIKCNYDTLTYIDFNNLVMKLANELKRMGVSQEKRIGVFMDRSIEAVIGIYAILKAGGTFIPIDVDYPQSRIDYIIEDGLVEVLISKSKFLPKLSFSKDKMIIVDDYKELNYSAEYFPPCCIKNNLAYIIYTSGTTGNPKGVMIEHQSLFNYISWSKKVYLKDEELSFPLYTSVSFDLTITSLFLPLISGNTLVIYPENNDRLSIEDVMLDNEVNIIKATPSHLKVLLELSRFKSKSYRSNIKQFILGGEILTTQLAKEISEAYSHKIEIYNEYGPTEATVGCMIYKYNLEKDSSYSVPIGGPIDNTQIFILSSDLTLLPIGVFGELCVSGVGLARGYVNEPEITREKFVHSKLLGDKRIYRTGDLARWLPDGNIEFKGRIDSQVKIRGNRIELKEIENEIIKIEDVVKCTVSVNEKDGDQHICAYYVSTKIIEEDVFLINLSRFLPAFMLPSYFIRVTDIVLSSNGKVDKKKLPLPNFALKPEIIPPESDTERKLCEIWSEVLKINTELISTNDDFFKIGGHSISAIQIINRINSVFEIQLSFKDIFKLRSISQISRYLETIAWTSKGGNIQNENSSSILI